VRELQGPIASSDAELMRRIQSGDREAFAVLIDRHKDGLVNYLTVLARNRDRAEDLAQETFVRLFERSGRYLERGQFRPYLYRIGTNLLRTEERRARRRQKLLAMFSRNGHAEAPSPQKECLREEESRCVLRAIDGLPLRFRSPLLLREVEGWSYEEIGEALNLSEGTVKSRIYRARERLKALLVPYRNGGRP
jgi:RNA polymerase sigma-70 factor (ECF subfamily)